jgi:predicted negative regulator of RcsB-dependent stress response
MIFSPFLNGRAKPYYYIGVGLFILLICLIFLSSYFYNAREQQLLNASHEYTVLLSHLMNQTNSSEMHLKEAQAFIQNYAHTPYAALILLQLAKQAVDRDQLTEAADWLIQASEISVDPDLKAIASIRAARVQFANGQSDQALQLLDKAIGNPYQSACFELKGDILMAAGRQNEAVAAYQMADKTAPELPTLQTLLKMKQDNIGQLQKQTNTL